MTLIKRKQIESGAASSAAPGFYKSNGTMPFSKMDSPKFLCIRKSLTPSDPAIVGTKNGLPRASFVIHFTVDPTDELTPTIVPNGLNDSIIHVSASRILSDGTVQHLAIPHYQIVNLGKSLLIDVMDSNNSAIGARLALGVVNLSLIPNPTPPNGFGTLDIPNSFDYIFYNNDTLRLYADRTGKLELISPAIVDAMAQAGSPTDFRLITDNLNAFGSTQPLAAGARLTNVGGSGNAELANVEGLEFSDFISGNFDICVTVIASDGIIIGTENEGLEPQTNI